LIGAARPVVRRDGIDQAVASHEVVLDDVIVLSTGDRLVVDGMVVASSGLEIDESLLTGEADPVDKGIGDRAMSGSFVVAGSGLYVATAVGKDSFASGLTEQAKKFHLTNSELCARPSPGSSGRSRTCCCPSARCCCSPRRSEPTSRSRMRSAAPSPGWSPWSPRAWCC
jgi:hypothetical protein